VQGALGFFSGVLKLKNGAWKKNGRRLPPTLFKGRRDGGKWGGGSGRRMVKWRRGGSGHDVRST
jgi:hypothetical protein